MNENYLFIYNSIVTTREKRFKSQMSQLEILLNAKWTTKILDSYLIFEIYDSFMVGPLYKFTMYIYFWVNKYTIINYTHDKLVSQFMFSLQLLTHLSLINVNRYEWRSSPRHSMITLQELDNNLVLNALATHDKFVH